MKISMRVESHLWTVRCVLLAVLVAPSLHCGDGGPPEACNCDCLDVPVGSATHWPRVSSHVNID